MTSLLRSITGAVRQQAGKALVLLAFATGIAGGVGLYAGLDGYYVSLSASHPSAGQAVQRLNGNPRLPLRSIPIPAASLHSALAETLGRNTGKSTSIKGYVFRNAWNTSAPLCLSAQDNGPQAGQDRDPVTANRCSKLTPNDIWIPEQWEANGSRFTWLVNYQYQSMCLDANNLGGLSNGHGVMLWNCYPSNNESWNFGDWYQNMKSGTNPYPICLNINHLCLDADKFTIGALADTPVNIWTYYVSANLYWF